ncbi:MAG: hypothetical protein KAJ05_05510 [Candidatus Latescibacteria bacterium]|nr:hypothetical protein [Candidatus Latescibacterota bacterium]
MRFVSWAVVCMWILGAGLSYAGENAGAVFSFDLELDGQAEKVNQEQSELTGRDARDSVVLSVLADGVSNLCAYAVNVRFDTTQVSFEGGGNTNVTLFEFDVFSEALLSPSFTKGVDPEDHSIVSLVSAVLPAPGSDTAPDGDGKFLGWLKFTTRDPFEGEARFSLVLGKLKGVDGEWDEVSSEGVVVVLGGVAVEPHSWGQVKATMK